MFSELTWLGAALLGLGVLVVGGPAVWTIVRAVRDHAIARDPFGSGAAVPSAAAAVQRRRPF